MVLLMSAIATAEVMQSKTCILCHKTKPLEEFHKDRTRGDGYKARCASCSSRARAARNQTRTQPKQNGDRVSIARVAAIKRLVSLHERDFRRLLDAELKRVNVDDRKWSPPIFDPDE